MVGGGMLGVGHGPATVIDAMSQNWVMCVTTHHLVTAD